ncbi:hypothetical protein C5F51_29680 [Nocardia nova]|uniref:AB hydrolase-1 domain-containing protein n=1 Tax=Nocardia nova TaxID=37330 RepID=A0A2S5ZYG9_9NOCA|nr:alpha/beta fold hydrolase [Nocardia nova]PPJ23084.1 hypothetical protein C5F51_29680 [Nocardia nova]
MRLRRHRYAADSGSEAADTVLLLHGFPEDRHCWDAMTPALTAAGYRVLAPDLRGYSPGARPVARSAYATARMTSDVYALVDAAGVERFHLVGHDWGAALAWSVAAERPARLKSRLSRVVPGRSPRCRHRRRPPGSPSRRCRPRPPVRAARPAVPRCRRRSDDSDGT